MRKDDERLAVPTPGGDAFSEVPVKAEKKHIVMFVIACMLLAGILLFLSLPTGMEAPEVSDGPADP